LLTSLGTSIANVALPTIAQAFTASFQAVQWVVLAYLLAVTTAIVSLGRLGDIIGRRRLLLAGLALFTGASVLCGVATTLWLLIGARAAQGLGAAIMMALSMALVAETVPKAKTGRAMGLLGTMSAIGTALGPSLGGVLIAGFGWRAIFLVNVPLGIITLLLAYRQLPRTSTTKTDRAGFDTVGTLVLGLTLAAYALAMTIGRGNFGPINASLLVATALGAALFVIAEKRAASPLIRLSMFRDPILSANLFASALVSTVMMATLVVGPFYLTYALRLDAALVGFSLSVGPLVAAVTGVPAGRAVDTFGAQRLTIMGLFAIAGGSFILSIMPMSSGIGGYIAPMGIITFGYALFQAANNSVVIGRCPSGPAGRHFRHAQPVAQYGLDQWCLPHGRRIRLRIRYDCDLLGPSRSRGHGYADYVRRGGGHDPCCDRHRARQPCPRKAPSRRRASVRRPCRADAMDRPPRLDQGRHASMERFEA
jgi:MFS family permease